MAVVGEVRVGLLGCGNVGGALARVVDENADLITARAGARVVITRVAVRDVTRPRDVKLPSSVFTDDAAAAVADPDVDVVGR
jgi:homoserine dehydrogenase